MKLLSPSFSAKGKLSLLAALAIVGMAPPSAQAVDGTWNVNALGNWSGSTNWFNNVIADGVGSTANITFNITGGRTVTIDTTSRTVGIFNVGDLTVSSSSFTIASSGGGSLILDNGLSNAQLNQVSSSFGDTISAPVLLNGSLDIRNSGTKILTVSTGGISSNTSGTKIISNLGSGTGGVTISGTVANGSGTIGIVQDSATSALTLSNTNTFTGNVSVLSGTLASGGNSTAAFGVSNSITLGASSGSANASLVGNIGVSGAYAQPIFVAGGNSGTATIGKTTGNGGTTFSGLVTLQNHDVNLLSAGAQPLILSGGFTGTGGITIENISASASTALTVSTGSISTIGNIILNNNSAASGISISAPVNNTGSITNSGIGAAGVNFTGSLGSNVTGVTQNSPTSTLTLAGNNVGYANGVVVRSGTLAASTSVNALGTGTLSLGHTSGSADATFIADTRTYANPITVVAGNTGVATIGNSGAASTVLSGLITLNKSLTVAAGSTGTVNLSGASTGQAVTGAGDITITSATPASNLVTLSGSNSGFTGNVNVNSGVFRVGSANALSSANTVFVNSASSAQFNLNGNNQTIAGVTGGGTVTNTVASARTLTLGGSGTYAFGGSITATTPANMAVTKSGSGKQTLSGVSNYTGATTVTAGTLIINGELGATAVSVSSNAILGGSGTLGGTLSLSGNSTLAPGNSPGILTVNDDILMSGDTTLSMELNGTTAGTLYDQIVLGGTTNNFTLDGGNVTLALSFGYAPQIGDSFTLIDNISGGSFLLTGGSLGFDNLVPNGFITVGAVTLQANNFSAGSNDLVLTVSAIPEPQTWMLLGLGFMALLLRSRSRRRLA